MSDRSKISNRNRSQNFAASARQNEEPPKPLDDLVAYARDYAREQPEMAALWCLGIGFVLGWKMKPW